MLLFHYVHYYMLRAPISLCANINNTAAMCCISICCAVLVYAVVYMVAYTTRCTSTTLGILSGVHEVLVYAHGSRAIS